MDAEQFTRIAKALADPRRFEILESVAAVRELACQHLCSELPVSQATVSHHLKELQNAGLIETRREGQYAFLRLRGRVFEEYLAELARRVPVRVTVAAE